jgi:hypothetical protein
MARRVQTLGWPTWILILLIVALILLAVLFVTPAA